LLHGLSVLIELLKRHINNQHDETTTVEQLPPVLQLVVANLEKFNNFLINPANDPESKNDAKLFLPSGLIEPLGFHRLKIIEFFAILSRSNYKCIDDIIIKLNILNTCLVS
jgi:hypothetical protein